MRVNCVEWDEFYKSHALFEMEIDNDWIKLLTFFNNVYTNNG